MSFREKISWVSLLSTVAIWSPYCVHAIARSGPGDLAAGPVLGGFIAAVVLQALLCGAGAVAVSLTSAREPKDERDRAIEASALKVAYAVLVVSGFLAVGYALSGTMHGAPVLAANGTAILLMGRLILLCFVVAEASRFLTQVIGHRWGA